MTVTAPTHDKHLEEVEPYIIEDVAYSPLKVSYLMNYDDDIEVHCDSCSWQTTVGQLPEDSGTIQPDICPSCAKRDELGFVRSESPADKTLPRDWNRNS